jgi:LysR family transcriptional regulator, glycine cleavage system transcriptional activator
MLNSMPRLPLHTLPTFRAVARSSNLRAAAELLHLTHSAVSQQIKLLEEQLGFTLFDRRGRRIVLNAAGQALLASTETALAQLDAGVQAASLAAAGTEQRLRVAVLPSFAQRWLLPRLGRWRGRHPDIALELDASQRMVDLQREGFHAAVRSGRGDWPGLTAEKFIESSWIAVAAPAAAHRLLGRGAAALLDEPLLGEVPLWEQWFTAAGVSANVRPVADFNDAGLMLQAAEHNLGLALARELFVADALAEGRLVQLSPVAIRAEGATAYYLVYPSTLGDWPPLRALRAWLFDELALAQQQLLALNPPGATGKAPAGQTGSRSHAASATPAPGRARSGRVARP